MASASAAASAISAARSAAMRGALLQDQIITLRGNLLEPPQHSACSSRNEAPNDHVFLQAVERVYFAVDSSLGQNPRRLLERCSRNKAARLE